MLTLSHGGIVVGPGAGCLPIGSLVPGVLDNEQAVRLHNQINSLVPLFVFIPTGFGFGGVHTDKDHLGITIGDLALVVAVAVDIGHLDPSAGFALNEPGSEPSVRLFPFSAGLQVNLYYIVRILAAADSAGAILISVASGFNVLGVLVAALGTGEGLHTGGFTTGLGGDFFRIGVVAGVDRPFAGIIASPGVGDGEDILAVGGDRQVLSLVPLGIPAQAAVLLAHTAEDHVGITIRLHTLVDAVAVRIRHLGPGVCIITLEEVRSQPCTVNQPVLGFQVDLLVGNRDLLIQSEPTIGTVDVLVCLTGGSVEILSLETGSVVEDHALGLGRDHIVVQIGFAIHQAHLCAGPDAGVLISRSALGEGVDVDILPTGSIFKVDDSLVLRTTNTTDVVHEAVAVGRYSLCVAVVAEVAGDGLFAGLGTGGLIRHNAKPGVRHQIQGAIIIDGQRKLNIRTAGDEHLLIGTGVAVVQRSGVVFTIGLAIVESGIADGLDHDVAFFIEGNIDFTIHKPVTTHIVDRIADAVINTVDRAYQVVVQFSAFVDPCLLAPVVHITVLRNGQIFGLSALIVREYHDQIGRHCHAVDIGLAFNRLHQVAGPLTGVMYVVGGIIGVVVNICPVIGIMEIDGTNFCNTTAANAIDIVMAGGRNDLHLGQEALLAGVGSFTVGGTGGLDGNLSIVPGMLAGLFVMQRLASISVVGQRKDQLHATRHIHLFGVFAGGGVVEGSGIIGHIGRGHVPGGVTVGLQEYIAVLFKLNLQLAVHEQVVTHILEVPIKAVVLTIDVAHQIVLIFLGTAVDADAAGIVVGIIGGNVLMLYMITLGTLVSHDAGNGAIRLSGNGTFSIGMLAAAQLQGIHADLLDLDGHIAGTDDIKVISGKGLIIFIQRGFAACCTIFLCIVMVLLAGIGGSDVHIVCGTAQRQRDLAAGNGMHSHFLSLSINFFQDHQFVIGLDQYAVLIVYNATFTDAIHLFNGQTIELQVGVGHHGIGLGVGIDGTQSNLISALGVHGTLRIRNGVILLGAADNLHQVLPDKLAIVGHTVLQLCADTGGAGAVESAVIQAANRDLQFVNAGSGLFDIENQRTVGGITLHVDLVVGALDQVIRRVLHLDAIVSFLIGSIKVVVDQAFCPGSGTGRNIQSGVAHGGYANAAAGDQVTELLDIGIVFLVVVCLVACTQRLVDTNTVDIELGGCNTGDIVLIVEGVGGQTHNFHHILAQSHILDTQSGNLIQTLGTAIVAVVKLGINHSHSDAGTGRLGGLGNGHKGVIDHGSSRLVAQNQRGFKGIKLFVVGVGAAADFGTDGVIPILLRVGLQLLLIGVQLVHIAAASLLILDKGSISNSKLVLVGIVSVVIALLQGLDLRGLFLNSLIQQHQCFISSRMQFLSLVISFLGRIVQSTSLLPSCIGCVIGIGDIQVGGHHTQIRIGSLHVLLVSIGGIGILLIDPGHERAGIESGGTADQLKTGTLEGEGGYHGIILDFHFRQRSAAVQVVLTALIDRVLTVGLILINTLRELTGTVAVVGEGVLAVCIVLIITNCAEGVLIIDHRGRKYRYLLVHLNLIVDVNGGCLSIRNQHRAGVGTGGMDRNGQPDIIGLIHKVLGGEGQTGGADFGAVSNPCSILTALQAVVDHDPGLQTGGNHQVNGLLATAIIDDDVADIRRDLLVIGIPTEITLGHGLAGPGSILLAGAAPVVDVYGILPTAGDTGVDIKAIRQGILHAALIVGGGHITFFIGSCTADSVGNLNPGLLAGIDIQVAGLAVHTVVDQQMCHVAVNGNGSVAIGIRLSCDFLAGVFGAFTIVMPVVQIHLLPIRGDFNVNIDLFVNGLNSVRNLIVVGHRNMDGSFQTRGDLHISGLQRTGTVVNDDVGNVGRNVDLELTAAQALHGSARPGRAGGSIIIPVVQINLLPVVISGNHGIHGHSTHAGQGILTGGGVVADQLTATGDRQVYLINTILGFYGVASIQVLSLECNAAIIGAGRQIGIQRIHIAGLSAGNAHQLGPDGTVRTKEVVILKQLTVYIQTLGTQTVVQNVDAVLHICNVDLAADNGVLAFCDILSIHAGCQILLIGTLLLIQQQVEGVDTRFFIIYRITGISKCIICLGMVGIVATGTTILITEVIVNVAQAVDTVEEVVVQVQLCTRSCSLFLSLLQQMLHLNEDVAARPLIVDREAGGVDQMLRVRFQGQVTNHIGIGTGGGSKVHHVVHRAGLHLFGGQHIVNTLNGHSSIYPQTGTGMGDFRIIIIRFCAVGA